MNLLLCYVEKHPEICMQDFLHALNICTRALKYRFFVGMWSCLIQSGNVKSMRFCTTSSSHTPLSHLLFNHSLLEWTFETLEKTTIVKFVPLYNDIFHIRYNIQCTKTYSLGHSVLGTNVHCMECNIKQSEIHNWRPVNQVCHLITCFATETFSRRRNETAKKFTWFASAGLEFKYYPVVVSKKWSYNSTRFSLLSPTGRGAWYLLPPV